MQTVFGNYEGILEVDMRKSFILFFIGLLTITNLQATIINVPVDQVTIQAGINAAMVGDTVLVKPGIYREANINFKGKNIVVGSLFMTTSDTSFISNTVINGGYWRGVVKFLGGEDSTAVLTGFTITNGGYSGGIECNNSSPTLMNLIISGNWNWEGGGIYCKDSSPTLMNVRISGNMCKEGMGGGIFCNRSNMTLVNVVICDNLSETNSAIESGGGICCINSNMTLVNVTISGNKSNVGTGGLNCLASNIILVNSILCNNSPSDVFISVGSVANIAYSAIQGGWQGEGNIDLAPLFVGTSNADYRLSEKSPCIGAGIDSIEIGGVWYYAPNTDCEGNPRPNPIGSRPDMGAYEIPSATDIAQLKSQLPDKFTLFQNYPNPFNPSTKIKFELPKQKDVLIKVFNTLGQKVAILLNKQMPAGYHEVKFNAQNLPSGVYIYKIEVGQYTAIRKCLLLK